MSSKNETFIKIGFGIWFCFCILISLWVFTRFLRSKWQLTSNLHVVEDSLRKMQEKIELEQRKKSMGCIDNLDDIDVCFSNSSQRAEQTQPDEKEDKDKQLVTTENEIAKLIRDDTSEETVEDKKNI